MPRESAFAETSNEYDGHCEATMLMSEEVSAGETKRYVRSEVGKLEIQERGRHLSRRARNLLMVIDGSQTGIEWVDKVEGSDPEDLKLLFNEGLIQSLPPPFRRRAPEQAPSLEVSLQDWSKDELRSMLTQEAKNRFGLIKGVRLVIQIETCSTVDQLRRLALLMSKRIQAEFGEEASSRFKRRFGD